MDEECSSTSSTPPPPYSEIDIKDADYLNKIKSVSTDGEQSYMDTCSLEQYDDVHGQIHSISTDSSFMDSDDEYNSNSDNDCLSLQNMDPIENCANDDGLQNPSIRSIGDVYSSDLMPAIEAMPVNSICIHVEDFSFRPSRVSIPQGYTIRFLVARRSEAQVVTHKLACSNNEFSGIILDVNSSCPQISYNHRFDKEGIYVVKDEIFSFMSCKVTVFQSDDVVEDDMLRLRNAGANRCSGLGKDSWNNDLLRSAPSPFTHTSSGASVKDLKDMMDGPRITTENRQYTNSRNEAMEVDSCIEFPGSFQLPSKSQSVPRSYGKSVSLAPCQETPGKPNVSGASNNNGNIMSNQQWLEMRELKLNNSLYKQQEKQLVTNDGHGSQARDINPLLGTEEMQVEELLSSLSNTHAVKPSVTNGVGKSTGNMNANSLSTGLRGSFPLSNAPPTAPVSSVTTTTTTTSTLTTVTSTDKTTNTNMSDKTTTSSAVHKQNNGVSKKGKSGASLGESLDWKKTIESIFAADTNKNLRNLNTAKGQMYSEAVKALSILDNYPFDAPGGGSDDSGEKTKKKRVKKKKPKKKSAGTAVMTGGLVLEDVEEVDSLMGHEDNTYGLCNGSNGLHELSGNCLDGYADAEEVLPHEHTQNGVNNSKGEDKSDFDKEGMNVKEEKVSKAFRKRERLRKAREEHMANLPLLAGDSSASSSHLAGPRTKTSSNVIPIAYSNSNAAWQPPLSSPSFAHDKEKHTFPTEGEEIALQSPTDYVSSLDEMLMSLMDCRQESCDTVDVSSGDICPSNITERTPLLSSDYNNSSYNAVQSPNSSDENDKYISNGIVDSPGSVGDLSSSEDRNLAIAGAEIRGEEVVESEDVDCEDVDNSAASLHYLYLSQQFKEEESVDPHTSLISPIKSVGTNSISSLLKDEFDHDLEKECQQLEEARLKIEEANRMKVFMEHSVASCDLSTLSEDDMEGLDGDMEVKLQPFLPRSGTMHSSVEHSTSSGEYIEMHPITKKGRSTHVDSSGRASPTATVCPVPLVATASVIIDATPVPGDSPVKKSKKKSKKSKANNLHNGIASGNASGGTSGVSMASAVDVQVNAERTMLLSTSHTPLTVPATPPQPAYLEREPLTSMISSAPEAPPRNAVSPVSLANSMQPVVSSYTSTPDRAVDSISSTAGHEKASVSSVQPLSIPAAASATINTTTASDGKVLESKVPEGKKKRNKKEKSVNHSTDKAVDKKKMRNIPQMVAAKMDLADSPTDSLPLDYRASCGEEEAVGAVDVATTGLLSATTGHTDEAITEMLIRTIAVEKYLINRWKSVLDGSDGCAGAVLYTGDIDDDVSNNTTGTGSVAVEKQSDAFCTTTSPKGKDVHAHKGRHRKDKEKLNKDRLNTDKNINSSTPSAATGKEKPVHGTNNRRRRPKDGQKYRNSTSSAW